MRASRVMRRRLLAGLALAPVMALAAPSAPGAGVKRIVLVRLAPNESDTDMLDEVLASLGKRGFAEGRGVEIHRLVLEIGGVERSRRLEYVTERIRQDGLAVRPDLFLTEGTAFTESIRRVTRTVPIVTSLADPVASGLAQSLARPGGNVTGLAHGFGETADKSIEFIRRLVPGLSRLAVFHGPGPFATRLAGHYARAARGAGIEPEMLPAADASALVAAIRRARSRSVQAGILAWSEGVPGPGARAAIEARLPLMGEQEVATESGCLASYYSSDPDRADRLAAVAEKVLRGADPALIPFQFPTTFRLVLNRRTALALGIELPADLLVRADRVIE